MGRKWKAVSPAIPAVSALLVVLCTVQPAASGRQGGQHEGSGANPGVNADAKTMAEFVKRVEEYEDLRRDVQRALPKRGDKATPEEIVGHRRALADGIRQARADARPGDLFTPDTQRVLRAMLAKVFKAPRVGAGTRALVNEDNPKGVRVAVNQPYPEGTALTTMPPEVLSNLPPLPEAIHYHFVGRTLILLDAEARLIVDFMANAMP